MSVAKIVDISTVHLCPETLARVQDGMYEEVVSYGKKMRLLDESVTVGAFVAVPESVENLLIPKDLVRVLKWAETNGYGWINIDVDAPEEADLPTYRAEWDKELGGGKEEI